MGCQVSIFEVKKCAFGDELYGVAESYSREGVDMEVNSPRSPEIGLWDSRSNRMGLFIFEMAKKKSCQNVRNPRVLSPAERELYGWVDAEAFTQSSVLASEHRPELCREMRLTQDLASERDYVLEAAGPFDWLPFRALEDKTLFCGSMLSCLRAWVSFSLSRIFKGKSCRGVKWRLANFILMVGVSSALSNTSVFTLVVLFGLMMRGSHSLGCIGIGGEGVSDNSLGSLGDLGLRVLVVPSGWFREAVQFSVSLDLGSQQCRGWGIPCLLMDMEKQSRYDRLLQKMAVAAGVGPRSVLPHVRTPPTTSGASASGQVVPAPAPVASPTPVPPPAAVKKRGSSRDPTGEEGAKEDPSADLKKKGRKRKASEASAEEVALGVDSAWEHKVSPINRAFPDNYNFRAALDAGLTNGPTREILGPLVPDDA
ncbi:hypothetical protein PIB30_092571 [Stylosanthes scabra]|uniref:Uncharacterized protein n=1 Tax=Stylosanthes scabra TaxID=79078 RepID=A0ABU6UWN3_9FABA|nr:hypothetical protein [Stylosanthes scabra]